MSRTPIAAAGVLLAGALGLASCGSSAALALARSACTHVERSIALYDASLHATSPTVQASDQMAAVAQLEAAQPDAATAAGEDAQWQALMTTISESPRIPERYLVYALGQQCAVAATPGGDGYVAPGTPASTGAPPPSAPTSAGAPPAAGSSAAATSGPAATSEPAASSGPGASS